MTTWRREFDYGTRSTRSPYMVDELEKMGHEVIQLTPVGVADRWANKIEHRLGYKVRSALNMRAARRCDVVLALLETEAWAYSRLPHSMGLPPLVTLECWLAEDLLHADPIRKKSLMKRARRLGHILSLSKNQTNLLRHAGLPSHVTHTIPFGVATDYFTPAGGTSGSEGLPGGHEILFVGQDRGRDFDTFLKAMCTLHGRHSALLVTKCDIIETLNFPENVVPHPPVSHEGYRELLRRASVVVVPTLDLAYPTGQSVALEAASAGTPIVVTDTMAMCEYITPAEAEMPPVADVMALACAIDSTLANPVRSRERAERLRLRVQQEFNGQAMWGAALPVLSLAAVGGPRRLSS